MQGSEKVIQQLNSALAGELTAIVQYMAQSEMCENWGYKTIAARTKARAIEEMKHAEVLIERLIFLDVTPTLPVALTPQLGANVKEQMEINLKGELDDVAKYNQAVRLCTAEQDSGSKALFESLIKDEERHVDYLEAQIHSIAEMGIAVYLAQQLRSGE